MEGNLRGDEKVRKEGYNKLKIERKWSEIEGKGSKEGMKRTGRAGEKGLSTGWNWKE
jgi:hypothetical protein